MPFDEFIVVMKKEFDDFMGHVDRVTRQYKSAKMMKEKLPENHVVIQMDFSENYNCQTMEEIQSAYWNALMVTLHPTIVYFSDDNGDLAHKSMVFVSEVHHHNAAMVSAIVEKTVDIVRKYVPDLQFIHFWTDSPSSQYRNKSIFYLISRFEGLYGCIATWHYFECGHGKSACDGVGGTTKRNADMAVKQNKAVIQDANDFFAWAVSSRSEIEYHMITPDQYEVSNVATEKRKHATKPLKGTMSLHAIAHDGGDNMLVRQTTCVCENCFGALGFKGDSSCKWDRVLLNHVESNSNEQPMGTSPVAQPSINKEPESITNTTFAESDHVIALYDNLCYIGMVLELDNQDNMMHITFMAESGKVLKRFRWPADEDKVWIEKEHVLRRIDPPIATGKTGRIFAVPDEVLEFIERVNSQSSV